LERSEHACSKPQAWHVEKKTLWIKWWLV